MCMKRKVIERESFFCERCRAWWVPRNDGIPVRCGVCQSPYWQTKKKSQKRKKTP